MSKPPAAPAAVTEPEDRSQKQATAVCRAVLTALGRPVDFLRITARQVTAGSYRVNVVAGPDLAAARIAHSFFVTADGDGVLTASTPVIRKLY